MKVVGAGPMLIIVPEKQLMKIVSSSQFWFSYYQMVRKNSRRKSWINQINIRIWYTILVHWVMFPSLTKKKEEIILQKRVNKNVLGIYFFNNNIYKSFLMSLSLSLNSSIGFTLKLRYKKEEKRNAVMGNAVAINLIN